MIYGAGVWRRGGGGVGIVWANRHTIKLCFHGVFAIVADAAATGTTLEPPRSSVEDVIRKFAAIKRERGERCKRDLDVCGAWPVEKERL